MKAAERKLLQQLIQVLELSIDFGNTYQRVHGLETAENAKQLREKKKELFNLIRKSREIGDYYQSLGKNIPNLT